jgi:hypothetical protein
MFPWLRKAIKQSVGNRHKFQVYNFNVLRPLKDLYSPCKSIQSPNDKECNFGILVEEEYSPRKKKLRCMSPQANYTK